MSLPPVTPEILKSYKEFFTPGKQVMYYIFDEVHTWLFGEIVEFKEKIVKIKARDKHHRSTFEYPEFEVPIEYLEIYVK